MPYQSQKQAAFMHIHHPDIAKRWDKEYYHKALKKRATKSVSLGKEAQDQSTVQR